MSRVESAPRSLFFIRISLPATAIGFALSVQMASLSWILSNKFGLKVDEIGMVWAAGPLTGIIGQMLFGFISDKSWFFGRRRPFIMLSGIVSALMLLLLPRVEQLGQILGIANKTVVVAVVIFLLDFFINIGFNPARSLIADLTQPGIMRVQGYSWMQTISGFGGVLAYVIGALAGNYVLIDVGVAIVFLLAVIAPLFIVESRQLPVKTNTAKLATERQPLVRIFVAHGFSWIGVFTMFVYMFNFVQNNLVSHELEQAIIAERSGRIINILFMIMNIVGFILPSTIFIPLIRKFGKIFVHKTCIGLMSLGYWTLFFTTDTTQAYFLMALVGIGWAAIVSIPFAIVSESVESGKMGFFMGLFNLSVVLPQLFVTLVLNHIVLKLENPAGIFFISGTSLFVSFLLWSPKKEASPG